MPDPKEPSQDDLDNHANQLNPNNDEYWHSRGEEDRPDDRLDVALMQDRGHPLVWMTTLRVHQARCRRFDLARFEVR